MRRAATAAGVTGAVGILTAGGLFAAALTILGGGAADTITQQVALDAQAAACTVPAGTDTPISISGQPVTGGAVPLTTEQQGNAAAITAIAYAVTPAGEAHRAAIIGVATAMQESTLRNLNHGDRDSLGLFQQRAAWGPASDRTAPTVAARMFYQGGQAGQRGLLAVPAWPSLPVAAAAQAVQVSAFPDAYARWEATAVAAVDAAKGHLPAVNVAGTTQPCQATQVTGATPEAAAVINAAGDLLGKPYVWGGVSASGADCSGMIVYAYQKTGHPLKVRTAAQMWAVSTPVPWDQVEPGDMIWSEFGAGGPGHIVLIIAVAADHKSGIVREMAHTGTLGRDRSYTAGVGDTAAGRFTPRAFT